MKPIPSERISEICEEIRRREYDKVSDLVRADNKYLMMPYEVYVNDHDIETYVPLAIIKYLDEVWDNEYFINLRNRKS